MGSQQTNDTMIKVKNAFQKAGATISRSSGAQQLVIGSASGWCTGFFATKVGKTAAITIGGTVMLVAAANQAGFINVNWDKFGKNVGEKASAMQSQMPNLKTGVTKYAVGNKMFAAGFIGGFLLGMAS